jgi:glycoprotein endo-alpha-1,2-mannosidase
VFLTLTIPVYLHWNHEYIPNWDKQDKKIYPTGKHKPPLDIGANYFPLLGCYSSKSLATVIQHFLWIQAYSYIKLIASSLIFYSCPS